MPRPLPPFDLDLLRSFAAVADCGGFTRAAERLGRTQSTVSLQIKRLEDGLGKRLFERGGRDLAITPEGEILLGYARRMLHVAEEARLRLAAGGASDTVRLGTPEDFATVHLADVLSRFARAHPQVPLAVNCDFTANLLDGFSRGEYDLILCKREPQGPSGGTPVWREPLVWAASDALALDPSGPVPLALAPYPDIYRKRAIAALEAADRRWRLAYSSPSLAGVQAAVRAGLGVTVLPREMVPPGLAILGPAQGFPALADTEIALYRAPGHLPQAAELLAEHIVRSLEGAQPVSAPSNSAPRSAT